MPTRFEASYPLAAATLKRIYQSPPRYAYKDRRGYIHDCYFPIPIAIGEISEELLARRIG